LAVLTVAGLPLAWRSFTIPSFSEGMAILSAARTLLSQSRHYEMETPLDYAIVHGRSDLHERLQKEGLPTEIGARMLWHEGPELSGATTALGLALGCVNQTDVAFDLSRSMKPSASLRDIFPWGELACQCALMVLMGLFLVHRNEQVHSACTSVQIQCDGNKVLASSDILKLEAEKKSLTLKIQSLHQFLDSRVTWTTCVRDVESRLPANFQLTGLQAASPLDMGGKSAGKKSLRFAATVPLLPRGAVPPDVFKFVGVLRDDPALKRHFPLIELGSISQSTAMGKVETEPLAAFTINCMSAK
jgi:hypothetical protein